MVKHYLKKLIIFSVFLLVLFSLDLLWRYRVNYHGKETGEGTVIWRELLNVTRTGNIWNNKTILNRTITFIVLRSSKGIHAIIPLITILKKYNYNNSNDVCYYSVGICISPLNYSAEDVIGCGWYDFNISKFLTSLEYDDFMNITDLGPRVFNIKFRSGEIKSNYIDRGDDIWRYASFDVGMNISSSEISEVSWFAMYLSIRNPMVFLKNGDIIIFPITFRLKYVFVRSDSGWNSLFFLEVLKKSSILEVKLHREGEIYYLNLIIKT